MVTGGDGHGLVDHEVADGRTAEAIVLLERTLPDSERTLGSTHPATLAIRSYLAEACQAAGSMADASGSARHGAASAPSCCGA